ncbi:tetratricopeptide repeat protein [Brevundimonas sp.]|uniref:tetratricopeptide repeat protein n=1 Tax=Brevundimonas sp. TaxID=1871086 RepID=UPI003A8D425E
MITSKALLVVALLAFGAGGSALAQDAETVSETRTAARLVQAGQQQEGLDRLERLADAGDIDAHNLLGEYYSGFAGVEPDQRRACDHFRIARDSRPSAAHNYGQCLWAGAFGERDFVAARVWYRLGADGGFAQAKCALGNMLMAGEGGPVDHDGGVALCREAAEAGERNAQTDLGNLYLMGEGVAEDHAEARRWYTLAAAQNQRNAAFILGQMYWNGDTVEKDNDEAARLWLIAYEGGRRDAALHLGNAALVRAFVDRANPDVETLRDAERWYELAIPNVSGAADKAKAEEGLGLVRGLLRSLSPR